jgi:hypothetical protein
MGGGMLGVVWQEVSAFTAGMQLHFESSKWLWWCKGLGETPEEGMLVDHLSQDDV